MGIVSTGSGQAAPTQLGIRKNRQASYLASLAEPSNPIQLVGSPKEIGLREKQASTSWSNFLKGLFQGQKQQKTPDAIDLEIPSTVQPVREVGKDGMEPVSIQAASSSTHLLGGDYVQLDVGTTQHALLRADHPDPLLIYPNKARIGELPRKPKPDERAAAYRAIQAFGKALFVENKTPTIQPGSLKQEQREDDKYDFSNGRINMIKATLIASGKKYPTTLEELATTNPSNKLMPGRFLRLTIEGPKGEKLVYKSHAKEGVDYDTVTYTKPGETEHLPDEAFAYSFAGLSHTAAAYKTPQDKHIRTQLVDRLKVLLENAAQQSGSDSSATTPDAGKPLVINAERQKSSISLPAAPNKTKERSRSDSGAFVEVVTSRPSTESLSFKEPASPKSAYIPR